MSNEADIRKWLDTLTPQEKELYLDRIERNPWLVYTPHPKQEEFHKSDSRIRLFLGGNRSGKTRALIQECIWYFTGLHPFKKVPTPAHIWVVSLDFPSSRDVVEPLFRKLTGSAYVKSWRETDRIIEGVNGSTISFKSVDSGWEKFQGTEKHLIAFDEEPEYKVYQECFMRTISTKGDIIIAMTPLHGMTWVYEELYEPWASGVNKDCECFISRIFDNPYIDPKEIERIERSFYDEEKKARIDGNFVEFAGLIYKEFNPKVHLVKRFAIPHGWVKIRGIDPGLNNPTACVWWAVSPDGEHYIYDEFCQSDLTIHDYAVAIKSKTGGQNISYTVIDPASCSRNPAHPELKSVRDEYSREGIWTQPANNDVSYGINCVKELLHIKEGSSRPQLYIFNDLEGIRKEITRYRWDTFKYHAENSNLKDKPRKVLDHLMDAMRYIAASNPRYISQSDSAEIAKISFKPTQS